MTQFTIFIGQLKYFSTSCARFHPKDTFVEQPNTGVLIANTSFLLFTLLTPKLQSMHQLFAKELLK